MAAPESMDGQDLADLKDSREREDSLVLQEDRPVVVTLKDPDPEESLSRSRDEPCQDREASSTTFATAHRDPRDSPE